LILPTLSVQLSDPRMEPGGAKNGAVRRDGGWRAAGARGRGRIGPTSSAARATGLTDGIPGLAGLPRAQPGFPRPLHTLKTVISNSEYCMVDMLRAQMFIGVGCLLQCQSNQYRRSPSFGRSRRDLQFQWSTFTRRGKPFDQFEPALLDGCEVVPWWEDV